MQLYKAIVIEKTSPHFGNTIGQTKNGQFKGMDKETFFEAVRYTTCWTIEIVEI